MTTLRFRPRSAFHEIHTPEAPEIPIKVKTGADKDEIEIYGVKCPKGTICVAGKAVDGAKTLTAVKARVYQNETSIPATPPGNATDGQVVSNAFYNYIFTGENEVPARCRNSPNVFKDNWLAVWPQFDDGAWEEPAARNFWGQCATETECD